jgi:hypothetical protein
MQKGLNDTNPPVETHTSAGKKRLEQALAERERFLEQHPHLRSYQAEVDRLLDSSGNHQGRMAVLGTLLQAKLLEMQKELNKLSDVLQEAVTSKS